MTDTILKSELPTITTFLAFREAQLEGVESFAETWSAYQQIGKEIANECEQEIEENNHFDIFGLGSMWNGVTQDLADLQTYLGNTAVLLFFVVKHKILDKEQLLVDIQERANFYETYSYSEKHVIQSLAQRYLQSDLEQSVNGVVYKKIDLPKELNFNFTSERIDQWSEGNFEICNDIKKKKVGKKKARQEKLVASQNPYGLAGEKYLTNLREVLRLAAELPAKPTMDQSAPKP